MYKFNPYAIPIFLTSIFLLGLGIFVFLHNKKSETNFSFLLLCLSASIWQFGYTLVFMSTSAETAIFWQKIVYLGVPFLTPAIYHFSVSFLKLNRQRRNIAIFYIFGFVFSVTCLTTSAVIAGLNKYFWGFYKKAGPLYTPFLILWLIPGFYGVYNLYRGYLKFTSPLGRKRTKYMFIAIAIVFTALGDFIPAYGIELYPFGYIGVIACLSLIAYAIVKYRLMDIAVAITRTTIFVLLFSITLGLPFLLTSMSKELLIQLLGANWWLGPVALMAILATSGPFVFFYLERKALAILLREQRLYQETLRHAAVDMTRIRNLQKLLDFIISLFNDAVRITHSAIYLFDAKTEGFLLKAGLNLKNEQPDWIYRNSALFAWLERQKEPLVYEEIKRKSEDNPNSVFCELEEQMRSLNATVALPCFLEGKLLDILILGDKLSGKIYTSEDLDNFCELAREVALAIENAQLYENIEEEVRQRTSQLIETQKQLVQAEKMATVGTLAGGVAHEINNPLTAILTNVQMLLTDAPSMDSETKESLDMIEEATTRCRAIVQKLMAYAKRPLETTGLADVDLLKVVKNAVAFLGYQFEQDNVKIIVDEKDEYYYVKGNQNELEQVVTNIVLNARDAIKQVKRSGKIHISLIKNNEWIKLRIKDDGKGIPKEIMPKIFDPFFTTKDVGKGMGLGLSICQSIVEKHKGTIVVQSEPNEGSLFMVRLPKAS